MLVYPCLPYLRNVSKHTRYFRRRAVSPPTSESASLQYGDAAKLARFKKAYQMLALDDERQLPYSFAYSTLQLDPDRFQFSSRYSSDDRTLSSFDNSPRAIIEWKVYHPDMLSGSATSRVVLRNRASHLAELMSCRSPRPENFNILTCMGYFDQVQFQRFGFAYEFPLNVLQYMPFTIHEFLTPSSTPDLGTRFKMALSLARTLNLLHTSGWLHKSIRSSNMVVFQSVETSVPEFENPYLTGFGFSRPDGYGEEHFMKGQQLSLIISYIDTQKSKDFTLGGISHPMISIVSD